MFNLIINFITAYLLGFYLITVLQWYSYKFKRVVFHFNNYLWHLIYFIVPLVTYIAAEKFFWIYLFFGLIPALFLWTKKIKRPLNITSRVKRFFLILGLLETLNLVGIYKFHYNGGLGVLIVLSLTLIISNLTEWGLFLKYRKMAKERLKEINPTIVTITASYGKTSIKNFVYELLREKFETYKTPRSVNTLKGLVLDVNTKLPQNTQIYVTEAGARERGDIKEIVEFLENEYSILGKIGPQHMEYFKSLENVVKTKCEIMHSKMKKGFSYEESCNQKNVVLIKDKISNVKSDLNGTSWDLKIGDKNYSFETKLLGSFNALNISLAVYQALEFINDIDYIQKRVRQLPPVPHRLEKIEAGGKIIIDDSFNGNIEGVLESYRIASGYNGRKVLITPGIIEATDEMNEKIAKEINRVFDLVIITGKANRDILCNNITKEKIYVDNKSKLEKTIAEVTYPGDLILFSNDLPDYL